MFYMIQLIPGFITEILVSQANWDGLLPYALCAQHSAVRRCGIRVR